MILIIGARSRIGAELVRLLRAAGEPLRILSRSTERAAGSAGVRGDLADPESLDKAMSGVDKVFLLSSSAPDALTWHRNGIDAAARAGVSHLVRISILGAAPASPARFIRDHGAADDRLRASGVPYTILRPNLYMHGVVALDPEADFYAPAGDARISMVDARDVASVAAAVLAGTGHAAQEYDITGPDALSYADVAEKLSWRLGRTIRYVPVDDATARQAMLGAELGDWFTDALLELFGDYRRSGTDGYAARVHGTVSDIAGTKPRTLDQVIAEEIPA